MKRLLIFLGAGAFLLCIVTPLFAQQVDIKSTGWIRVRYRDWNNFLMDDNTPTNTSSTRNRHYFDTRIRMGVAANIEPGLKGVIEIERTDDFGAHSVFNANASPSNTATGLGTPGNTTEIYFRQAWVDFAIPGTPIHIVGGRMLYTVGGSIVFSGADNGVDGIQVYSPLGPGTLTGYYFKPQNGDTSFGVTGAADRRFANNDFDMIGGSYKFEWSARNGVELYGLYSLDKTRAKTLIAGTAALPNASAALCTGAGTVGTCGQTQEWYAGANFFGVQGPFTYRLEGAYMGGTARKNVNATSAVTSLGNSAGDIDRSAGMVTGGLSYALVPELALNLDGGWASGDDNPTDNTYSNFAGIYGFFQPTLLFSEGNPFGNTAFAQFGNPTTNRSILGTTFGTADLDLGSNSVATVANNGQRFSPGMIYAKPGVKWVPVKQLTVNGDVGLLWAAVTPGGVDSYIGTEIDLKAAYQVYKNLVTNFYFGYMFAGGYFDTPLANNRVDDPWFARVEFIFTF
ncbi:MAG: alginate export family protein [Candidatus Methylomirabilales bacterium]